MKKDFDYETIVSNINSFGPELDQPASQGDLLKVYGAMALQQEVILDAMHALTSMVSDNGFGDSMQRFGKSYKNLGDYINSEVNLLLLKAKKGLSNDG